VREEGRRKRRRNEEKVVCTSGFDAMLDFDKDWTFH